MNNKIIQQHYYKENLDAGHSWGLKGYPVVGLIFENL